MKVLSSIPDFFTPILLIALASSSTSTLSISGPSYRVIAINASSNYHDKIRENQTTINFEHWNPKKGCFEGTRRYFIFNLSSPHTLQPIFNTNLMISLTERFKALKSFQTTADSKEICTTFFSLMLYLDFYFLIICCQLKTAIPNQISIPFSNHSPPINLKIYIYRTLPVDIVLENFIRTKQTSSTIFSRPSFREGAHQSYKILCCSIERERGRT